MSEMAEMLVRRDSDPMGGLPRREQGSKDKIDLGGVKPGILEGNVC